jgi:TonB family protein
MKHKSLKLLMLAALVTLAAQSASSQQSSQQSAAADKWERYTYAGEEFSVESKAIIVFKPEPAFTEEARHHNVTGVVRLRVVLAAEGRVRDISVIKGLPDGLTEKAINAARHMLFLPAQLGGRAVSMYATLEYHFNIY